MKHRRSWHRRRHRGAVVVGAGAGRHRRRGAAVPAAATPKRTTTTTATAPTDHDHRAAAADRAAHRPARPGGRQPHPARAVGEGREHRRRPAPGRHRPGRRRLRGGRRGQHHALPRDLQLAVPDVIGPVRSVRAEDPDIVWPLGGIFAYSGGAPVNVDAHQRGAGARGRRERTPDSAMVRNEPGQPPREAPHNLYGLGRPLFALGGDPAPPTPLFQYLRRRARRPSPVGERARLPRRVRGRVRPDLTWDARHRARGSGRSTASPHDRRAAGTRSRRPTWWCSSPTTAARPRGRPSARATCGCSATARLRTGRWVRPDKTQPARYVDAAGKPILLRPGRTWVELLPTGRPST